MAANLVKAGFDVVGHNRSRPGVDRLVAAGGRGADSIAKAVKEAQVVATMLPDAPDVEAVLTGHSEVAGRDASAARPRIGTSLVLVWVWVPLDICAVPCIADAGQFSTTDSTILPRVRLVSPRVWARPTSARGRTAATSGWMSPLSMS